MRSVLHSRAGGLRLVVNFGLIILGLPAAAQTLPIGSIDFYGVQRVPVAQLRGALTFKIGDPVSRGQRPPSIQESMDRLMSLPGIRHAQPELVCCTDNKVMIFVGIEETGAPALRFLRPPVGSVRLPAAVLQAEHEFDAALPAAILRGNSAEDDSTGEARSSDPTLSALQRRFSTYARDDLPVLRDVLRNCADAHHRAVAALVLGYVTDKQAVVPDLAAAALDSDPEVRNNAVRTLAVFAGTLPTAKRPALNVPYEPFVALLDSPVWSDRNKASFALMSISKNSSPALIQQLRDQAMSSLIEMARWTDESHALPALIILGHMAGYSDQAIITAVHTGQREQLIRAALGKA